MDEKETKSVNDVEVKEVTSSSTSPPATIGMSFISRVKRSITGDALSQQQQQQQQSQQSKQKMSPTTEATPVDKTCDVTSVESPENDVMSGLDVSGSLSKDDGVLGVGCITVTLLLI